jgi:competence protein ComEC
VTLLLFQGTEISLTFSMVRWIPYAFVRIVLFFMMGIGFAIYFPGLISQKVATIGFLGLTFVYVFTALLPKLKWVPTSWRKVFSGVVGLMALIVGGYLNVVLKTDTQKKNHLIHVEEPIEFYEAVIISPAKKKERSWKVEAKLQKIKRGGEWISCTAKILLYFSREDFPSPYQYGDVVIVAGKPEPVKGPSNPEEFNYAEFLRFKNIYHQDFIRKDNAKWIKHSPSSWLEYYALQCRTWADDVLKRNVSGEREQAVASAFVLGVTDGLDNDLLSAYKGTGAMHVLAVSGLHVGIIYGILLFLLKPLEKTKYGPWMVAGISVVVLWTYAFITGLSPSVLRAVTMFSFLALAKPGGYRTNIYNTLAASAFCILLYDPSLMMSVGFQLSYLAVLGIVYLQGGIYNLWEPNNRIVDEIWKVSSISLAAQIATFSLGLLYFHQFPNYFLLSNLFVIPGSFIVLVGGLILLLVGFIDPVANILGVILEWIIKLLNIIVFAIDELPFSLIENVYITTAQCWMLFGILLAIILLIQRRKFIWMQYAFSLIVMFALAQWYHFQKDINIQKLTIYNVNGHTAIDLIDKGQAFFIADSALSKDLSKIQYHISPSRIKAGTNDSVHSGSLLERHFTGCSIILWKSKTFLRIYDKNFSLPTTLAVDYMIVSNNAVRNWFDIRRHVNMKQLIFDSSNSIYYINDFYSKMNEHQRDVYSVIHQGTFELTI